MQLVIVIFLKPYNFMGNILTENQILEGVENMLDKIGEDNFSRGFTVSEEASLAVIVMQWFINQGVIVNNS